MSPSPSFLDRYLAHLRHERRLADHTLSAYARDGRLLLALEMKQAGLDVDLNRAI